MRFRDFELLIKPLPAFNLNDIRKIEPGFHRQQITDWLERGYILSLAGGYYLLAGSPPGEADLFMAANRIYEPSYISLESALAYYQVIPESVPGVTCISSRKTRQFASPWGTFSYRSLKPIYLFGYQVVEMGPNRKFKLAGLEKAVLDYLYLHPGVVSIEELEGLRWNREALLPLEDSPIFRQYQQIFNKKALDQRIHILMEYLHA